MNNFNQASQYPFPYIGAGEAAYYESASLFVCFKKEPSVDEKKRINELVPAVLTEDIEWDGITLYVSSHEGIQYAIGGEYEPEPGSADSDLDVEAMMANPEDYFQAPDSLVSQFNAHIEKWLLAADKISPVRVAFRGEDGEAGGTELSPWHEWSLEQAPGLLDAFRFVLDEPEKSNSGYLLSGILDFLEENEVEIPKAFYHWANPGSAARAALESGDVKALRRLLGEQKQTDDGLSVLVDDLDDKQRADLLSVADLLLENSSLPYVATQQLVHQALHLLSNANTDASTNSVANAKLVLVKIKDVLAAEGDRHYLNAYAHRLLTSGQFQLAIAFYELLIPFKLSDKSTYCNALYAVQDDNCHLGIESKRHRRFLDFCLPYAPENPDIYVNAACLYWELGDAESVYTSLSAAVELKNTNCLTLQNEPLFGELFGEERFKQLFSRAQEIAEAPSIHDDDDNDGEFDDDCDEEFIDDYDEEEDDDGDDGEIGERNFDLPPILIPQDGIENPLFDELKDNEVLEFVTGMGRPWDEEGFDKVYAIYKEWMEQTNWAAAGVTNEEPSFMFDTNTTHFLFRLWDVPKPRQAINQLFSTLKEAGVLIDEIIFTLRTIDDDGDLGSPILDPRLPEEQPAGSHDQWWAASFDQAQLQPPTEDEDGMFSVLQMDDGTRITEYRPAQLFIPGVRVIYNLADVENKAADERTIAVTNAIVEGLNQSFCGASPPIFNADGQVNTCIDKIENSGRNGYGFALKRDQLLRFYPDNHFRYREYELMQGLSLAIGKMNLEPVIHWDRDAVYIINLWEKLPQS